MNRFPTLLRPIAAALLVVGVAVIARPSAFPGQAPAGQPPAGELADLVLRGGKVITLDGADRVAEAIAVRGNRIAAVGSNGDGLSDIFWYRK